MSIFVAWLSVAMIACRVFVKGETIIVKNPNWKMRGLACVAMGLALIALSMFALIGSYVSHVPILNVMWIMLATGIFVTIAGIRVMKRSPATVL